MGSVLLWFATGAAVGASAVSGAPWMMVKSGGQGRWRSDKPSELHCVQLGGDPLPHQQSEFYSMVTAPNKSHSGICIVAVLEIDTQP